MRCRLSWLTNSALVYEPKCGWAGGCGVSANEYSCAAVHNAHGAQINFGDIAPYITYEITTRAELRAKGICGSCPVYLLEGGPHGLINFIDTKAKCCHGKKFTFKGTLRQVVI
jgi:hypothetical protein